ncbi:testis-specific serine/threonine-protein kinase 2-like [Callorhinchus milii]|uniref:non-specific serine/threonine protein kinase n=1 Tax=Callorhinchus milii TaxID=7868 RepID=A0A4W3GGP5_CALMI|nr:testis-specific serine/threonine-protein kinase 2-like [Callorhinchus milii]|eukprot:gi/632960261/ref/XP_007896091.1/ PREDICTED: testis-specific serine/threonine-protein kinase 2-like [Callorhinchus milii]
MDLTILGYQLGEVIGEGTYSVVKKAFSPKLGKSVAIKVIDKSKLSKTYINKFLKREIKTLTRCYHPNIVKVHEIFASQDTLLIVMEEAKLDLYELINSKHHLSERVARQIFKQITEALKYCHDLGIAHRDLKCENILLITENCPKLSDFGFACSDDCSSSTFCGSPAYAAPEILNGEVYNPFKADIWSLGVILYLMVTGCMPFNDNDLSKLVKLQAQALKFPPTPCLTACCQNLIIKMIKKDPAERSSINNILAHPWFQCAEQGA